MAAQNNATNERLHLLGIRHHGPGSAALLRQALDALDPACVLIEGPSEGDALIPYIADLKPPVAMLLHAADNAGAATFMPFAEFSPEWQAMLWALQHQRSVRFIDWPAAISLALKQQAEQAETTAESEPAAPLAHVDALDLLAAAAGYEDGEAFWNSLIEQHGGNHGDHALAVFAAIETAMTEARAHEETSTLRGFDEARDLRREAWMRTHIRAALKEHEGNVAVVCGAWHLSALRSDVKAADDRTLISALTKDLPRIKVEATWVPWTDSRLSTRSGYGAGVISPGWYRHLWSLYARPQVPDAQEFAALWQSRTAFTLRQEGYGAPTASAIDATQLALSLAALRGLPMPGLAEMRDASLATLCHGNPIPLTLIEQKLYIGERVGEIGDRVPQMPLARDLALWQRKTRLKPEDLELEVRLDLRSEAGLLKSTLLHRLNLIHVPWGKLLDANSSRGTFREVWMLRWQPELSVALAEALIYGVTIEQAAANATLERARDTTSVTTLATLVQAALIADLPNAATACIDLLQAAAVSASDITDLMRAVSPLVRVLRYGSARKLPEDALRALILSLSIEINAGVRIGSRSLDEPTAAARLEAMEAFDEALTLFADPALSASWHAQLAHLVNDDQVVPAVAGLSLRRLHDRSLWPAAEISSAFARHTTSHDPAHAGAFLEAFLRGGSEILLQDAPLLQLIDAWLCSLSPDDFTNSLPLLRRSLSHFDTTSRRRLLDKLKQGPQQSTAVAIAATQESNPAFAAALPLLYKILGLNPSETPSPKEEA
jgi:hypothetical protein